MDFTADNQSGIQKIPNLIILVADDDILNQRMMQLILTREGHLVDLVSNGMEALESIKIKKYDIVFMDLQMPLLDGIEASRRIRHWESGGQHTFIVALTASYLPEDGQVLFDAGIDNYISKPFEMEQIHTLLKYGFQARLTKDSRQSITPQLAVQPEVLDFRKGIAQIGGNEQVYRDLLSDFVEGLPNRLQTLQRLFANKDLVELSRAAHNLNGIAASLGASELSECAKKLDKQGFAGYTDSLDLLIQEIQHIVDRLLDAAHNFLADKPIRIGSV